MSLLQKIADRLILQPSRKPIDAEMRQQLFVSVGGQKLEIWRQYFGSATERDLVVIKFIGAGGRAERAGPHPIETWRDVSAEIWAVNPPGYGGSDGRASVQHFAEMATRVYDRAQQEYPATPVMLVANSIGSVPALFLATQRRICGMFVRNPPPLKELILGRYSWWNFGWFSKMIVARVPEELDSVLNAGNCSVPAFFSMSTADNLVPPKYQQMIVEAYSGPKRLFKVQGANHDDPPAENQRSAYIEELQWLKNQIFSTRKH